MGVDGFRLWWYFLAVWVVFWATAGGVACRSLGRPAWRGVVLGGLLAPIGILLALVLHEDKSTPDDRSS